MKRLTEAQITCLKAVEKLSNESGSAPSAAAVARWLGVTKHSATSMMHTLARNGWMVTPKVVVSGEWELTPAARHALKDKR